jgi:outer membrane murein-binding lipoprotein Lpp
MLAAVMISAVVAAATPDAKVDQAAADFRTLSRIAALASNLNDSRQVMLAIVDNDLENLRERRPDETYRWASLQREEASRVKDQKSIERVSTEKELREVTLTAPNAYRLEVSVPTKQSLLSKNNRVYVRNVLVDSTGFDGKITHHEIPVDAWVSPGDSNGVALPEIGKSVKATAELGVESGDKRAVADVALLQAKLVDDPASPYFPVVQRLLKTREVLTQKDLNRGFLKSTVDEALLSLPGELEKRTAEQAALAERRKTPTGVIGVGDASPDVLAALQEITRLLGGNLQDQTDARAKLQTLIDSLQPPKPATTVH